MSPLEEASRDPEQNAGFVVTWVDSNQESRISRYCVQTAFQQPQTTYPASTTSDKSPFVVSLPFHAWSASRRIPANFSRLHASTRTGKRTFAAFKVLPIDPARNRRESSTSSGPYSETSEEVAGALSCREVVDRIVESISRVCEDSQGDFIANEDVIR